MSRYQKMFDRLKASHEGAFIPFIVLGDPDAAASLEIIEGLIGAGADALELGFPFSDPVADGPVIQRAGQRSIEAGTTQRDCFESISTIRANHPDIPIGLLVYANLVTARGMDVFFKQAKQSGVDSVLVADLPERESAPFREAANAEGIDLVLVLPVFADEGTIRRVARQAQGYLYLLSRKGITGAKGGVQLPSPALLKTLRDLGAPPPVLGFGIGNPDQVRAALVAGCEGVISGSAIVERVEAFGTGMASLGHVFDLTRTLKEATRSGHEISCRTKEFAT